MACGILVIVCIIIFDKAPGTPVCNHSDTLRPACSSQERVATEIADTEIKVDESIS